MSSVKRLPSIGEIARRLGQPIHRIEYLVKSRGIEALGSAGNAKVYSEAAVETIASEIARIDRTNASRSTRPLNQPPDPNQIGSSEREKI